MCSFHFTVRIISKSFIWAVRSVQEGTYPNFRQRPILRIKTNSRPYAAVLVRPSERYIKKQTELETENKQHGR